MAEATEPKTTKPPDATVEDDSDPDFDDLDDVLDQFSAATASNTQARHDESHSQVQQFPSSPAKASQAPPSTALPSNINVPSGPSKGEDEEEFMSRLTAEMSSVMSQFSQDPAASAATPEDIAKMGQELEEFTRRMEAEGIKPEDMLRAILGEDVGDKMVDAVESEKERIKPPPTSAAAAASPSQPSSSQPQPPSEAEPSQSAPAADSTESASKTKSKSKSKSKSKAKASPKADTSFESTILQTLSRMENSSAAATSATQKSSQKSEEDLLAEMLRALEASGAGGDPSSGDGDNDVSKMFLQMMEQLTHKSLLYEPMKELSEKYPSWLTNNQPPKLSESEHERFSNQRTIVDEIVARFEKASYSDDNGADREFIWEKMQKMQDLGAPPEDLVANPFPGMGMPPGLGGLGEDGRGPEEGCPTQ
ncbi:hypothetical protein B0A52_05590 [Exophiala mesophila]|uniref:Peroxin-19 n=1 Tax=Exophiala mesophila TaxID=212818 RepID=A0A438N3D7_EXOME|nr:hypothetical protein B0A52_05590 [Exophiala mesophila]